MLCGWFKSLFGTHTDTHHTLHEGVNRQFKFKQTTVQLSARLQTVNSTGMITIFDALDVGQMQF